MAISAEFKRFSSLKKALDSVERSFDDDPKGIHLDFVRNPISKACRDSYTAHDTLPIAVHSGFNWESFVHRYRLGTMHYESEPDRTKRGPT